MDITFEYFCKEYLTFREMIGLKKYSTGHIFKALQGLLYVLLELKKNKNVTKQNKNIAQAIMESMMSVELPRRMALKDLHSV